MLFYVNHSCRRLITRPAHTARENTLTKNVCRAAVAAPKAIHPVRLGPLAPASASMFRVPVVGGSWARHCHVERPPIGNRQVR